MRCAIEDQGGGRDVSAVCVCTSLCVCESVDLCVCDACRKDEIQIVGSR